MFGVEFYSMDEIARFAIREIAHNLLQRAAAHFGEDPNGYQLERDRFLDSEGYREEFGEHVPQYSLMFCVKRDCFALCIDQTPGDTEAGH